MNFSFSDNKMAYFKKNLPKTMKNKYYFIEFTSSNNNDKNVSFFLYDNQNELLIPKDNETFSKDFNLININQDIIMNFKWNVDSSKYLRANWTSNCDKDFNLTVDKTSFTGINNYNIIEYNKNMPIIFTIPNNCDNKILKLNFDIDSKNKYDLKEIIYKTDYIYFDKLYYYMSVLNYDNNLMNYFKFTHNETNNFEYNYIISNRDENELVEDIESKSFNNFTKYSDSIQGYQINETDYKYIILKITNPNSNYVSEIKTLNIDKEIEIIPNVSFTQINLTNSEIYKIVLDISNANKYLFYIKNYNIIEMRMMNNSFKDLKTNLFYIDKNTTNSYDYFNITLNNNLDDNSIQIYNDINDNAYIYNFKRTFINNFSGNFSSNQNLYLINIYDDDSQNKVLYSNDYGENINIYYKFDHNDLNLENFINFNNERLNYPIIADKKFDLLSINCSNNINCSYSIIYKKLYNNNSNLTITANELYEFFVSNNQPLNIFIDNPESVVNSFFYAKLLKNSMSSLLNAFISMDNKSNVQLNNNYLEGKSEGITDGKYLYLKSENGDSFITLNFSFPYYQINNYDNFEKQFNSQYNLFIIPDLKSNEFINLIIFSDNNQINIFYEEKNESLIWEEPNNKYTGTKKTFHITSESKKKILLY